MAHRETGTGQLVIRLVFDGPPLAGKTTTLDALSHLLGDEAVIDGGKGDRTEWFDWLEHAGGVYDGQRIRFQVLAVPGQAARAARRRLLLLHADVVICVLDSTEAGLEGGTAHLADLVDVLGTPRPCPVIVQANKQDAPGAAPAAVVAAAVARVAADVDVVPASAVTAEGLRPLFVQAVRRALQHLRETGDVLVQRPRQTHEQLMADLAGLEPPPEAAPAYLDVTWTDRERVVWRPRPAPEPAGPAPRPVDPAPGGSAVAIAVALGADPPALPSFPAPTPAVAPDVAPPPESAAPEPASPPAPPDLAPNALPAPAPAPAPDDDVVDDGVGVGADGQGGRSTTAAAVRPGARQVAPEAERQRTGPHPRPHPPPQPQPSQPRPSPPPAGGGGWWRRIIDALIGRRTGP